MSADGKTAQAVQLHVIRDGAQVLIRLTTAGVPDINIPIDAQAAFEAGEALARAAHHVRFGGEPPSDISYLREQIKARTTEQFRHFLVNRIRTMLNSMREDKKWTNQKLAEELVDTVVTKFA